MTMRNESGRHDEQTTVKEAARGVAESVGGLANRTADAVEETKEAVEHEALSTAQAIRDKAPSDGPLGRTARSAAGRLDAAQDYLEGYDFRGLGDYAVDFARRYPLWTFLGCVGLGLLLERVGRRR